ncbi:MAG: amino acid adenylation domain-containing protein, partial [Crocinitomix sp.]
LAQLMTRTEREIDQSEVIGEVELTPIQQWFFETDEVKNFNHFNQSILLKTNEAIDSDALDKSIEMLTEHHDALRMVFKNTDEGWQQTNRNLEEKAYAIDFYDLHNSANALEEMAALGNKIQASISITDGPLLKVVHFKLKTGERLGLILHHLVVDGVSWRIILEDLSTLYSQFKTNQSIKLPQKSDAFKTWSTALNKYATSPQIQYEKAYWETISKQDFSSLSGTENNVENVIDAVESFQLDKATTELLQTQVHAIYKTEINDILLTCLGRAIDEVFEVDKVLLQLEGHGREDLFNDIDISRTVGWFTAAFPFVLDVSTSSKTETNLINVKEALRTIPTKGIGYGVLKYLTENSLPQIDAPVVSFNYLGDFGSQAGNQENSLFEYSDEAIGANIAKENENRSILDLAGVLVIGELNLSIRYSSKRFEQAIIQELALAYKNNLQDLIETLARRTDSILTPSDLSFKGLTIAELSTVNAANKLEDVYELSPLQEGIYYHWLSDEESEQYLEQATYTVRIADLSKAHLERAYSKLIERHSVLRTHFSHDYANNTLQFVNKEVVNEFLFEKIADTENVTNYIKESIQKDRATPFDLSKGSQMRLKVVDLSGGEYVFIWTYHHILMDGWCTSVLVNDFNEFLSAEKAETQVSLAPVKPYANYINWLKTVDEDISLKYWSDYLNDYSQVAEIPFQLNKQEASFSEGREELNIEGQLLNDIGALCQEIGITQNTFIQGVWGYLLAQYNNTNDVVFGAVVSGRPAELNGVEEMIGLFINSIPVRIKYETSSSVVDFLKTIQEQSIETTAHHYLNLSKVQSQSELGIGLINHIMIFENYAVKELEHDAELTVDAMEVFERTNYDFNITVVPSANNLTIRFDFNENSFDGNLMKQLVDHFNNLTAAFVNSANEPMHQLDYLSANEKQELLRDFNNTTETYPIEKTIQTIFEEIVNENPANTAICFEDRQLSYQELNEQSNQLAHYLQTTYKIQPDDLIGIKQDRSEWMIISILAILKSGGAYVPIDPAYPADRIRYIEEDINCKVTLDSAELEKFKSVQYNSPRTNVKSITETNHLAYVTYTSGSTGKPKGVMITHTDLVSFIAGFDTGKGKRIAGSTNLTFDISGLEIWGALCTGKELVLLSNDQLNDPFQFIEKIEQANVNVLQLTPSRLAQIYLIKDAFPSSLDLVLVGGEMLNEVLYNWLKEQPFKSINVYGPTETTIWSTALIINDSKELSIGKPLTNEQVYILSNENNLQAKGVIGEICIGGDGVARGYLNRKELTEEKFIETPFNGNARIYKTGDLGMWLPNGNLACLGRKDDQIKIRGHRIELGEIEHALQGHKTINEVIVLAKENELVAYLTINADKQELSTSDLRAFLKELIPLYMLPAHFVQLEQFPLNTNGKIDKKALPKPDGLGLDSGMEYVAPRTEIERKLVEIWEALLTAENIGIKADFFALGGHSLMAIRLTNAYQKELNVKVAFKNLLADTVLESHARLIEQSEKIDFTPIPVVNVEEGAAHGYQISDAQQRLWILSQMEKGSTAYSITGQVPLAGEYEIAHFKRAVEATVERHEILRTNFRKNEQGEIRQWVLSNTELSFEVKYIDFRGEKDAEAAAQAYINEDSLVPFDLANDPLLRASLLQLTDGAYVFYYNMHHITSDAWSLDVLTNDVLSYYEAFSTNSKPKLSPLTIQYKDYAAWQAAELREEKASSHKNFWNENLTGPLPVLEFPFINKRPAVKAYNGKVCATFIDADITEQMRTISRSNGGTLFHGMLASWLVLVHKYSGAEDLIMGTSVAGRNHPDLHNQIGFYSNSVALRNEINPAHDFNETLKKVIENTHQAMDHQSYPFNQLVSDLKLERDLSKHPVFDNMIVFQSDRNTADLIDIEGIDFDEITNSELNAKFDMEISIMDLKDIISFRIIYDAALFSQSKVKNILLDYKLLLTELLSDPTENIEYVQFKNLVQKELRTANLSKLMSK